MPTNTTGGMELGTQAPEFNLPDPKGKKHKLADAGQAKAFLVVFMCNHCPYVKHLKTALVDFAKTYQPRGLAMFGINSNNWLSHPEDSPAKMQVDIDQYGYTFPYLVDESQEVAKAYGAVCTPEFFLFDSARKLTYHGRFDESTPGNGRKVTGADLARALDAILSGEPAMRDQTPAMGCSIKWRD